MSRSILFVCIALLIVSAFGQFQGGKSSALVFDHCAIDLLQYVTWLVDFEADAFVIYHGFDQQLNIIDFTTCGNDLVVQFNTEFVVGQSINNRAGAVRFIDANNNQDVEVYLPDQRGWTSLTTLTPILVPSYTNRYFLPDGFSSVNVNPATTCLGYAPVTYISQSQVTIFNFVNKFVSSGQWPSSKTFICQANADGPCGDMNIYQFPINYITGSFISNSFLVLFGSAYDNQGHSHWSIEYCELGSGITCIHDFNFVFTNTIISAQNPLVVSLGDGNFHILSAIQGNTGIYYDYYNGINVASSPVFNDDSPIFFSSCCIQKVVFDAVQYTNHAFAVVTLVEPNPNANYQPNPYNEQLYRIRIDVCEQQNFFDSLYCNRIGYFPNTNLDYDLLGTGQDVAYSDIRALYNNNGLLIILLGTRINGQVEDHTFSHENYIVNAIHCTNINCTTYSNYLLADSLLLWNGLNFNNKPSISGVNVALSPATGLPVVTLSTADGPPFLLFCLAVDCSSASLVRTSDSLAGHYGDFGVLLGLSNVVVSSPASWGITNSLPFVHQFTNGFASPISQLCTASNVGNFYSVQGTVLLCTRVGDRLFNPTTLYSWVEVGGRPRSYAADGNQISTEQTQQNLF